MRSFFLGLFLALLSFVSALSAVGSKLLVVVDDEADKGKYSTFWSDLQSRGFQITFRAAKDAQLSLFEHGEPAYSHLLLLPTKSKGLGPALQPNLVVDFVNAGSNVLLALSGASSTPSSISSLLLELDVQLPQDRTSLVVDHFNYDSTSADEKHDVLLLPAAEFVRKDIKNYFSVDGLVALPRAVGQLLGNASPHLSPVLRASETAYTYNPKEDADGAEEPFATGSQISLVTAFQAVNSARFTILGSSEALEDAWFDATVQLANYKSDSKTSNRAFAQKLSAWTFKEAGVLRAGPVTHFLNEGTQKNAANSSNGISLAGVDVNPNIYRIKNDVYYSIEMSEWVGDHWEPFTPAAGDNLQLEFSMLSPFHRLNLIPSSSSAESTLYTQTFKLPDQHGIYNFFVEYRRPFLTNIEEKRTVTVRHFAHDEYPRSYVITGAYPWISGIWVTIAGWVGFVALWLYSKPSQPKADIKLEKKL